MPKNRARNLDDTVIAKIVGILDGWNGKLTWGLLIDAIEERLKARYTRQALDRHDRVKDAYALAKGRVAKAHEEGAQEKVLSPIGVVALQERFERLQAENARLKLENERFAEQFVRWAYNAHLRGLTEAWLNTPLPAVDRERTVVKRGR